MPSSPHEIFKVFLLSSDYRPSVDRPSTEYWPITVPIHRWNIDELSAKCRRKVGEVSVKYRWTKSYIGRDASGTTIDRVSNECRPTIVWISTDYRLLYRPSLDRLSTAILTQSRLTIDRVSTDYRPLYRPSVDRLSTAISTDRSVDTTYNKQNPKFLGTELGVSGSAEPSILILMYMHLAILCPLIIIIWSCIPLQLQSGSKTTPSEDFCYHRFAKKGTTYKQITDVTTTVNLSIMIPKTS